MKRERTLARDFRAGQELARGMRSKSVRDLRGSGRRATHIRCYGPPDSGAATFEWSRNGDARVQPACDASRRMETHRIGR